MRVALSSRSLAGGSLAEAIERAAGHQVSGLEVWVDDLWGQDETPERLGDLAREQGLDLSAYASGRELNILSPDAEDRERSLRWAVEAVVVARRLGAATLTLEPGRLAGGIQTLATGWRPLIAAARTIAKTAEDHRLRVGFENPAPAPDRVLTHLVDAQSLLREVDSPYVGLCLNLSHLAASAEDAVDWLGGTDRVFQMRVAPDRPRRTLRPVLGDVRHRALFVGRLESAGYEGQVVLDDAATAADPDRLSNALADIRRWFFVGRPAAARRVLAAAGRDGRPGTSSAS